MSFIDYPALIRDFAIDFVSLYLFSYAVVYKRFKNTELFVTISLFNIFILLVVMAIVRTNFNIAVGFGLFALLSLLQLRSAQFAKAETGFLFGCVALAVINGAGISDLGFVLLSNLVVVLTGWIFSNWALEHSANIFSMGSTRKMTVTLDHIDEYKLGDKAYMNQKLSKLLGVEVIGVEIKKIDYIQNVLACNAEYQTSNFNEKVLQPAKSFNLFSRFTGKKANWKYLLGSFFIMTGIGWGALSSAEEYKLGNAMIVARSIDISSTIDGAVVNEQPAVGTKLQVDEMLVKIRNTRVDNSRITELQTKVDYLKEQIKNSKHEKSALNDMLTQLKKRSVSYNKWLVHDLKLKNTVKKHENQVAEKQKQLRAKEVGHTQNLVNKKILNVAELETARTKEEIAEDEFATTRAELNRNQLMLKQVQKDDMSFESGDASYWQKMIDSLTLKIIDNDNKVRELRAQLAQSSEQEKVETSRLATDFVEEHRAPFTGVVNAVYVSKGAHVRSGTILMQVLDCSHPVVIVPIPESHFSDFSAGQKVTINPIDSDQDLVGTIQYISSGPLINLDKTIVLQQELTEKGNHVVISIDNKEINNSAIGSCDTARRAVVTISTHFMGKTVNSLVAFIRDKTNLSMGVVNK